MAVGLEGDETHGLVGELVYRHFKEWYNVGKMGMRLSELGTEQWGLPSIEVCATLPVRDTDITRKLQIFGAEAETVLTAPERLPEELRKQWFGAILSECVVRAKYL